MHRITASLLALSGALTFLHGNGRADPRAEKGGTNAQRATGKAPRDAASKRDESASAKDEEGTSSKKASDSDAKGKSDAKDKAGAKSQSEAEKTNPEAGRDAKKATVESNPKKGERSRDNKSGEKKLDDGNASLKKPANGPSQSGSGAKVAPAWTKGQPGVVRLVRGSESLEVRVLDKKQHLVPTTLPQFARFLRSKSGADHPIDARLVTLVATVSDHFGGRELNVVSGFRPYSPNQYSKHSNHNEGRAIDFSVKGIANETVRDFCRTLRNVGVGYYPNSLFVHLDVRESNAYWVDYAAPGQPARYRAPDGTVDDEDEAAISSVDRGPANSASPSDTVRADVTRGRDKDPSGLRRSNDERGIAGAP